MRDGDHDFFFKFYRMTPRLFDVLLTYVKEDLTRQHVVREPLEPGERLAITLSYLASGQDIKDVTMAYRVGIETARLCIHATCWAIWARLKHHFMKARSRLNWVQIAEGFATQWQFPNCLGAVDVKHVAITAPADSGSVFFNYKGTFSIVLMAAVDSTYKYTLIDVGAEGRQSDGGVFKNSDFGRALDNRTLDVPSMARLPYTNVTVAPYVFVGDEAFQLRQDFVRPFPVKQLQDDRRVFNYRLSRARREVTKELANLKIETFLLDFPSCCQGRLHLHNFLTVLNAQSRAYTDREDRFGNVVAGCWRQSIRREEGSDSDLQYFPLEATHARNFHPEAGDVRDLFMAYFCSTAGEVPWQWHQPGVSKEAALRSLYKEKLLPLH
ncbi:unnamed protein product [Ixodes hexagonus]